MTNNSFLDKIAAVIITEYQKIIADTIIVLPNKRAKIFLIEALKKQTEENIFSPKIISIEDFVQSIAEIRTIDPIELLFEFYEVYLSITDNGKGFDTSIQSKGIGFINIYNRIDAFGGEVKLNSSPGKGCSLEIIFPITLN